MLAQTLLSSWPASYFVVVVEEEEEEEEEGEEKIDINTIHCATFTNRAGSPSILTRS